MVNLTEIMVNLTEIGSREIVKECMRVIQDESRLRNSLRKVRRTIHDQDISAVM